MALLTIAGVSVELATARGAIRAVQNVDLTLDEGRTLGIVGESGSGKTMLSRAILQLLPPNAMLSGRVELGGQDLTRLDAEALRRLRGPMVAAVFQDPMTSLNPVLTIGTQIVETLQAHFGTGASQARGMALELLAEVGIPAPAQRLGQYPHQLSGGMRQRVIIAMALVMNPVLVIADEPTTALDVTIQAQILELLGELQRQFGTSVLLITHDLGVVAETVSRVLVMYGAEIVEEASVVELFAHAHHPYTEGLLNAMPRVGRERERLETIPGTVPPPTAWPHGCRFHDRCPYAWDRCASEHPPLYQIGAGHVSRCHLAEEPQRRAEKHEPLVARTSA